MFIHRSLKRDTTFVFYDTKYPFGQYSHRLPSQPGHVQLCRLTYLLSHISLQYVRFCMSNNS